MKSKSRRVSRRNDVFRRKALAIAIGSAALGITGMAWGQAVNGTIYGTVPVAQGETIQITGGAGFNRTITVGPSGKYSITLPVGTYTVSLLQDGKVVQSRTGVSPVAAGAVAVDFAGSANGVQTLGAVNVTANRIPAIDVSTTNQVTTITSKQLQQLPLQRTAEDIALLAPGVGMGSPELVGGPLGTPINVFGGASTAENAYYVDGMNTTEMLNNQGGITLPYGAIEQQQTFISGYDARYGRSIGGVINQIGKNGSNEWHFGARASWQPASWRSDPVNYYFNNPLVTDEPGYMPGDIAVYRKGNSSSETIYDAYASGPIIKDKLFFFVGAEQDDSNYKTTDEFGGQPLRRGYTVHDPKLYAKLDWNINDNNILTLSGLQNEHKVWTNLYDFDYGTLQPGASEGQDQIGKTAFRMWVANYTSYLTDNLTLNAMLGKVHGEYYTQLPVESPLPYIANSSFQDPRLVPPGGYGNAQPQSTIAFPGHSESVMNYRVSLDYKLGTHDFQIGIDNINSWDILDGSVNTGPGYQWIYGKSDPGAPIMNSDPNAPPYVGPSSQCYNGTCYYVQQHVDISTASMRVAQRAAYVMDNWQATPNLLLNLGLRDDSFVNYDASGEPYIRATKPQWAPRLGFSWDVHGDSTLKVFGNAGRYYLALPTQVALSIAAPVTNAGVYYTYTGIDPETGEPTGLTAVPQNPPPPHGVSIDSEYGQAKDPRISASQNVKNEFSDNYVLGLQQQFNMLGTSWVFGATGTYQKMSRIIDDFDDEQIECAAGRAQGYAWMTTQNCPDFAQSLVLINPGVTQNILMKAPDGSLVPVTLTAADQQFPRGPTRKYYSVDLSLSHEWDGKWFAKFDYVWAQTIGNTEGPVSTYSQQSGSYESITTAWDFPLRMDNSYGFLPNDRRNTFKIYGAYAINPDWTVGGNLYIASGTPRLCRGHFGPDQQAGSGTYYWCGGVPVPPGSNGRLPWTHQLSLNVDYKPKWADHKLDLNFAIFNVFNEQTPVFYNDFFGTTSSPNEDFGRVQDTRSPRYARFSVSYDF